MIATCHPDRPGVARGLCAACYQREWHLAHPGARSGFQGRWRASHPEAAIEEARRKRELYRQTHVLHGEVAASRNSERSKPVHPRAATRALSMKSGYLQTRWIPGQPAPIAEEPWRSIIREVSEELAAHNSFGLDAEPPAVWLVSAADLARVSGSGRWGIYGHDPGHEPLILLVEGLPYWWLRRTLRHELWHWLQDLAGLPRDDAKADIFADDAAFIEAVRREPMACAPPGWRIEAIERAGLSGYRLSHEVN